MTHEQILKRLKAYLDKQESKAAACREWGVNPVYLGAIERGARPLTSAMLKTLGYERVKTIKYVKVKDDES